MGTGDKKKVAVLGVLVVGLLVYYFAGSTSTTTTVTPPRSTRATSTDEIIESATARNNTPAKASRTAITDFRPRVMGNRPGDKIDPNTIDPTLRLDLLAKVQAVEPIEAGRNLFQFGQAPAPDKPLPAVPTGVPHIQVSSTERTPPAPPAPTGPAPPPPPPPINLKYYGYTVSKADGHKEAFLMDGDDVLLGAENQTLKKRYRIVRIALNSIDIEDTQYKNTQTLKLQDLPPS
jgi:hypothetical protein